MFSKRYPYEAVNCYFTGKALQRRAAKRGTRMIDEKQARILQRLVDGLDASQTDQDMKTVLSKLTEEMGFDYFAYGNFRPLRNGLEMPYVSTTYPSVWTTRYIAKKYHLTDPVVKKSMQSPQPFVWHTEYERLVEDKGQAKFFVEASEHGVKGGYAVPIYNVNKQIGLVVFGVNGRPSNLKNLANSFERVLPLTSMYFDSYVSDRLSRQNSDISPLTKREVECLKLAHIGKNAYQISHDLGISYRTVYNHWDNARNKLGVANIREALAICAKAGVLTFE